jgi:hypothetical protein
MIHRVAAVVLALAAFSSTAQAAPRPSTLWATVNICDTLRHPDQMGVRASMPGNGTRERMFMRFHAQFYDASKNTWSDVKTGGVSPWILAGSAMFVARQAGYTFTFKPPAPGSSYTLRGAVDFQWRAKRHRRTVVVRRARANTKGGLKSISGADPPGYSSGVCTIH